VGGVRRQGGEGHGRGQPVLVAELGGGHAVPLLDLREVALGGHQDTRHGAVHVVLLRGREGGRETAGVTLQVNFTGRVCVCVCVARA